MEEEAQAQERVDASFMNPAPLEGEERAYFLDAFNMSGVENLHPELEEQLRKSREQDEALFIKPKRKKSPVYKMNPKKPARKNKPSKRAQAIQATFKGKTARNLLSDLEAQTEGI